MSPANNTEVIRLICRVDQLQLGDLILTPAHRSETVIGLNSGEQFSRSIRVATDETGPDHPGEWVNHHRLIVQRRSASALASVTPIALARPTEPASPATLSSAAALPLAA